MIERSNSGNGIAQGTILHFNFSDLGGRAPEFVGNHPAIVLSPADHQRQGLVVVVPVSSNVSNAYDDYAVELTHRHLTKTSDTGRSFAVCDMPVTISLDRASLNYHRFSSTLPLPWPTTKYSIT